MFNSNPDFRRVLRTRIEDVSGAWAKLSGRNQTIRLALIFAYFLYLASASLLAGVSLIGSLILSIISLGLAISSMVLYTALRDGIEDDLIGRTVIGCAEIAATIFIGLAVILPLIVYLSLGLFALGSLPLILFRA